MKHIRNTWKVIKQSECFKIQLFKGGLNDIWNVKKLSSVKKVLNSTCSFSLIPTTILADPFLVVNNDKLYLFYESKKYRRDGVIKMLSTSDLKKWTSPKTVLKEDFHLSYPFVFENEGYYYMIPETSAIGEVRLYKADNCNLQSFSYVTTLLKHDNGECDEIDIDYSDSSIYIKDGLFFLITTVKKNNVNELLLFYSSSLFGPYIKHSSSPICSSMKYGRNAGCFINVEGILYRVAQDCDKGYGDNVHLFQIDEINEKTYKEHLIEESILPCDNSFYKGGGHQYNIVKYKDNYVVATDAKEYRKYAIAQICDKIKRCLHNK